MEDKKIALSVVSEQIIMRKLAFWAVESKGSDIYFLNEAVQLLIAEMGEEIMKEVFGEKFDKAKKVLRIFSSFANQNKIYYDKIDSGHFKEEDKIKAVNAMKKVPMIQSVVYKVLVEYIKRSNIQFKAIPHESFQKAKFGNRPVKGGGDNGSIH